jgi:hypothetical protein
LQGFIFHQFFGTSRLPVLTRTSATPNSCSNVAETHFVSFIQMLGDLFELFHALIIIASRRRRLPAHRRCRHAHSPPLLHITPLQNATFKNTEKLLIPPTLQVLVCVFLFSGCSVLWNSPSSSCGQLQQMSTVVSLKLNA